MDYLEIFSKLPHINGDGEIVDDWGYTPSLYHFDGEWQVCWHHCEDGDGLFGFSGSTPEEAIQKAYDNYEAERKKITSSDTVIKNLIEVMKRYNTNKVSLYRYMRDNDGDWWVQDMRELYDERDWPDNVLNGKYIKETYSYPDDVEAVWNEIVSRELWKNPKFNIGTDGIYDQSIMSAGHKLTIDFIINDNGTYKFDEVCEFY